MGTEKIALVTDSACDASDAELAELGVECIHLQVLSAEGTEFPQDNTPENIEAFYDYLETCDELPTTSQPSTLQFAELYTGLALEGYTHIISMHLSGKLSGTVETARMAAQSASVPVEVIDTHSTTVAQLLIVRRIAQLRDSGATFCRLVDMAHLLCGKASVCFMIDTLKNLVKGGRVGKASGLAASVLNIKPLLAIDAGGEVSVVAKTRSMKRAVSELVGVAAELVDKFGELEVCFMHVRQSEGLAMLKRCFEQAGIRVREVGTWQTGPVITTHVGTGCVGFAYIPVEV